MLKSKTNEALRFWAACYKAGVRLTMGSDGVEYTRAWNYWRRLTELGGFGRFPDPTPVEPALWIQDGVNLHSESLRVLLSTKFPVSYERFAFHLLILDYELKPIEHHAHKNKVNLRGVGVDGGWVLTMVDYAPRTEQMVEPPLISPILAQYKEVTI